MWVVSVGCAHGTSSGAGLISSGCCRLSVDVAGSIFGIFSLAARCILVEKGG